MTPLGTARTLLGKLRQALPETVDLLICSASYEKRSIVAPLALPTDAAGMILVCANEDVQGAGKAHALQLVEHFGERAVRVTLSKVNPVVIADTMMSNIREMAEDGKPLRCVVDITTFTHEALLILLKVLQISLPPLSEVTYIYTPAKDYDPGTPTKAKWLSRGLGAVRSVLGYPGTWLPSKKVLLLTEL